VAVIEKLQLENSTVLYRTGCIVLGGYLGPFEKTVLQGIARKNECPELCASGFRTHGVVYDPFRRAENPDMFD
jgi:hypothetical protein